MKKILILSILVSFVAGLNIGYYKGIVDFSRYDSLPRAVMATGLYKKLKAGNSDYSTQFYETEIDIALDNYLSLERDIIEIFPKLYISEHVKEKPRYISKLIEFRKVYPEKDLRDALVDDQKNEYIYRLEERRKLVNFSEK